MLGLYLSLKKGVKIVNAPKNVAQKTKVRVGHCYRLLIFRLLADSSKISEV